MMLMTSALFNCYFFIVTMLMPFVYVLASRSSVSHNRKHMFKQNENKYEEEIESETRLLLQAGPDVVTSSLKRKSFQNIVKQILKGNLKCNMTSDVYSTVTSSALLCKNKTKLNVTLAIVVHRSHIHV